MEDGPPVDGQAAEEASLKASVDLVGLADSVDSVEWKERVTWEASTCNLWNGRRLGNNSVNSRQDREHRRQWRPICGIHEHVKFFEDSKWSHHYQNDRDEDLQRREQGSGSKRNHQELSDSVVLVCDDCEKLQQSESILFDSQQLFRQHAIELR